MTGQPPAPLLLARRLAPALAGLRWAIGGSTLLHRLGIEPVPADLDIVTVPADFASLDERLSRLLGSGHRPARDRYRSAHFKRFDAAGTPLDAMAGIAVLADDGRLAQWDFDPLQIDHDAGLPWMRAAQWAALYALFQRPSRVAQLDRLASSSRSDDRAGC